MKVLKTALLTTFLLYGMALPADAGTITKVSAAPTSVVTGQTVTFTEEGTNPCGASNMTYGDGIVITYAITELPARQTHVFEKPGTYTVIARGMGNCDGEATTTVEVRPAAAPPPNDSPSRRGPTITSVEFVPAQAIVRRPVTFVVNGAGPCRFAVDFGDGNSRDLSADLPYRFDHTYAVAGKYTTIVTPSAPCSGRFTQVLTVGSRASAPRIFELSIDPPSTQENQPVTITVDGTGSCSYAIDFGDGNNDSKTGELPDRIRHNYPAAGEYLVTVTALPPCTGSGRRTVRVRGR